MTKSLQQMVVAASVATVWTTQKSPRDIDKPALQNPVEQRTWLTSMSLEEKLQLCADNLVQTQALYGTKVFLLEETGEWAKIAIPEQASVKETLGYPGWVPKKQLTSIDTAYINVEQGIAVVTSPTAFLYRNETEQGMEISFLTKLPVIESNEKWITVATPEGPQYVRREAVELINEQSATRVDTDSDTGRQMVVTAKMFLGLPYLWGGISGFGFDCSGFVYTMHRAYGITIPRDSTHQAMHGVSIEREDLAPGDLLFFAREEGKGRVHHVGMYIGNNQMIHSPDSASSVEIVSLAGYKYEKEHCISRRYW